MKIATISSKRQITLSKDELEMLGIDVHQRLIKQVNKGKLILRPLKMSITEETAGSLTPYVKRSKLGKSWNEIMRVTKREVAKKLAQK